MAKRGETIKKSLGIILFLALILVSVYPFIWMILNSFRLNTEIFQSPFGLPKNWDFGVYQSLLEKGDIWRAAENSALIAVLDVITTVVVGSLAAFAFSHLRFPGSRKILAVYIGTQVVSGQVVLVSLYSILRGLSLFNNRIGLLLVMVAFGMPVTVFLFYNFFRDISHDIYESTQIDGCGNFRFYCRILMPLSMPIIASVVIFTAMGSWNEYLFALTFIRTVKLKTLTVVISTYNAGANYANSLSNKFALLSFTVVPILLIYIFMQRYFIRGLTSGSVKG